MRSAIRYSEAFFINTSSGFGIPVTLKALLEPDIAVLVMGSDSFFAPRKDLELKINKVNITIIFRGRKLIKGMLAEDKMKALQAWHKSRESWLASSFYQATATAVADAGLDPLACIIHEVS